MSRTKKALVTVFQVLLVIVFLLTFIFISYFGWTLKRKLNWNLSYGDMVDEKTAVLEHKIGLLEKRVASLEKRLEK